MKQHIVLEIVAAVTVFSFLALSFSVQALTLSAGPSKPTSALTTYINGADRANFSITVPFSTSTTGAVAGDILQLYVNGASFPSPVTATLSSGDIAAGSHTFDLSLTFANNLSNGVKNFTAALTSNGISFSSSSPALTLTLDSDAPTLSPVSVTSNNATALKAVAGNTVTLSFSSNEGINTPTVTLAGHSVTPSGGPTSWSASTVMISSDSDGTIPFSISFSDLAGNVGSTISNPQGGGTNVTYDHTPPVISSIPNITRAASTTEGTSVNFVPIATDALDGGRPVSCNYTSGVIFPIGTSTVSCTSSDSLGNGGSASFTVVVRTFVPLTSETALTSGAQQAVANSVISGTSNVTIPSGVSLPTLNLSPLLVADSGGTHVSLGGALTVSEQRDGSTFTLRLPAGLTITGPSSWNGVFNLLTPKESGSVTVVPSSGNHASNGAVIGVGSDDLPLAFDRAVRLLIPHAWQEFLGWSRGSSFSAVSTACSADDQDVADAQLATDGNCRVAVGEDLALWTKRPGSFVVYSESPSSSSNTNSGGSGGGGGSGSGATDDSTLTSVTTPAVAAPGHAFADASLVRPADIQRDGVIDILDFNSLMVGWNTSYDADNLSNVADTNGDGLVDILDFNTLMVYWGSTYQL